MLLTPPELKMQTRDLWRTCFNDSEEFLDIYFEEKYNDEYNLTFRVNAKVIAAMQLLPYRFTFYGSVQHVGYVSGLCTHPNFQGKGYASQLLREAHRKLFRQGGTLSFLIPGSEELREFYQKPQHGAYWTSVFRKTLTIDASNDGDFSKIEVTHPDEWGRDIYIFYRHMTAELPFMVHPAENDFFAALASIDLNEEGYILVARRKRRIVGVCVASKESDGQVYMRTLAISEPAARAALVEYLKRACGVNEIVRKFCIPGGNKEIQPYAMARVINVQRFLSMIAAANPGFQLHIGIDGDLDIPENNGYYIVENGTVRLTDLRPESIITPGGLAAMFLAGQPMVMDLMMDE